MISQRQIFDWETKDLGERKIPLKFGQRKRA